MGNLGWTASRSCFRLVEQPFFRGWGTCGCGWNSSRVDLLKGKRVVRLSFQISGLASDPSFKEPEQRPVGGICVIPTGRYSSGPSAPQDLGLASLPPYPAEAMNHLLRISSSAYAPARPIFVQVVDLSVSRVTSSRLDLLRHVASAHVGHTNATLEAFQLRLQAHEVARTMRKAIETALRRAHAAASKASGATLARRTPPAYTRANPAKPAAHTKPSTQKKPQEAAEHVQPTPPLTSKLRKLGIY